MVGKRIRKLNYEYEYLTTINKKAFINLMKNKFPKLKLKTIIRRWYDCKKKLGEQNENKVKKIVINDEICCKPNSLKMLELGDMKRFGYKITRKFLQKYGFKYEEINWLEKYGEAE